MEDIDVLLMDGEKAVIDFFGIPIIIQAHDTIGEAVDGSHKLGGIPFCE